MLRPSSSVLTTAALRAAGRRPSRFLSLSSIPSSNGRSRSASQYWSSSIGNRKTSSRPPCLEAARRPLQGQRAHDCESTIDHHSSRASSSWGKRPSTSDQERQQQERERHGTTGLSRRRRLSSTPWWVGGPTAPPAPPARGTGEAGTTASRSIQHRQQEARETSSGRQRNHQRQQVLGEGWASELLERASASAAPVGPTTRPSPRGGRDRGQAGEARREGKGTSQLVNQSIIRRLASVRRSKDWRSALKILDTFEREAEAAAATVATAAARGVPAAAPAQRQRQVWCREGLASPGDAERARTTVYNMVLDILSARRRWREAFSLLETMQERGVTADIYTLNSVLNACSSAGQVELSLALLKEMRSNNRDTVSSSGGGGGGIGKGSTGTGVAPLLPAPDLVSFNIALAACARAGKMALALELLEEMKAASTGGSTGTATAAATGQAPHLSPAPPPNLASYNSVLTACGRGIVGSSSHGSNSDANSGKVDLEWEALQAMDIFEAMRSGADGAPSPSLSTYKEMINAYGRAGRWEQALAVVEDAVDDGLELTSPVFCAMITAFGRGGEWRQALTVLYEDMPRYQVLPDKFCYNMALRACADAGQIKEALEIMDENISGRNGVNGFSYSSIMDALARQGESELAMQLLREVGVNTRHEPNGWHYGAVSMACLKAGDEDGALSVQSEWRDKQAREATNRMTQAAGGTNSSNATDSDRQGDNHNRARAAAAAATATPPLEGRGSVEQGAGGVSSARERVAGAPGDRFEPLDLLCLAVFHADNGAWTDCLDVLDTVQEGSRSARAAVRARANELLLGRAERGERIGSVGATGVEGAGIASWRDVAARNSDATERMDEAEKALRGCYEAAVEALGRAGRWRQALEVLEEGASIVTKNGLSLDPACFVPALRACCAAAAGGDGGGDNGSGGDGRDREAGFAVGTGAGAGAALLEEMEARAGVAPDAWCANVVMEAAVRDEQWSLASALFDQAEARHTSGSTYRRREGSGLDDRDARGDDGRHRSSDNASFGEEDGRGSAAASGRVAAGAAERLPVRPEGGGRGDSSRVPRELMKGAIDATAPTARTYSLALQACRGAALSGEAVAGRAVSLVRKMAADPMAPRTESVALALQVCALSRDMAAVVEIRRIETEAKERHPNSDLLDQWRQRRGSGLYQPRSQRLWWS